MPAKVDLKPNRFKIALACLLIYSLASVAIFTYLIAALSKQVLQLSEGYQEDIVLSIEPNMSNNILIVRVADDWYQLEANTEFVNAPHPYHSHRLGNYCRVCSFDVSYPWHRVRPLFLAANVGVSPPKSFLATGLRKFPSQACLHRMKLYQ